MAYIRLFSFHIQFCISFACACPLIPKKRVILSTGLYVLAGEEAKAEPFLEFVSQA